MYLHSSATIAVIAAAMAVTTAPADRPERAARRTPAQGTSIATSASRGGHSASDVALASDPRLWDKIAPFQSVYAQPSPDQFCCLGIYCYCDSTVCIDAHCDPHGHCVTHNTNNPCDDFNPCTTNDTCSKGACVGVPLPDGTTCATGNACTSGTCSNGTCVGAPLTGSSCDDFNPCTTNDTCTSNGTCVGVPVPNGTFCGFHDFCSVTFLCESGFCTGFTCDDFNVCTDDTCDLTTNLCVHSPISCDDGSACTADSCDPTMGCVHTGLPEEAGPLAFMDQVSLVWDPALGASIYNTYRGTIPAGGLSGRSPLYDHVCFESGDAQLNGPQLSVDGEDPPVGTSFYYLVDGEASSCGEGPLGTATNGTPEMPLAFCPTPP